MPADPVTAGPNLYVLREPVRILYVDDDPILREFALVNLATDNAVIDTAGDGAEALEKIAVQPPDIVLMDLEMPVLDGFQTLERLRADPRRRDLPVIVVTSREDLDAIDRAYDAGATTFVVKPMNWRLLSHQIRYVCRNARHERELAEARAATAQQLARLAAEGAHFISQAVARDASLRSEARPFAKIADAALSPDETSAAA